MRKGTIAFLIGIIVFLQVSALPDLWYLIFLPLTLYCVLAVPQLRFPCAILCGVLWALLRAELILSNELDRDIEGETVMIKGQVVSLPDTLDYGIRFEFQVEEMHSLNGDSIKSPGRVRLGWYQKGLEIEPGEYWQLYVRLKRPYGFSNPGGFDYEGWLFQHRIRATGYVRNNNKNELLQMASLFSVNYQRHLLRNLINKVDISGFEKSFISALSLGDRSHISKQAWQTLTQTGTSHLLAISGLHVGLVAGLFFIVGRWLWALTGFLPLYLASQRFAALTGFSGALIYAALAGFSIPTQRALIMLSVWMLSIFFNRKFRVSDIITISLLIILIIDPFAAMDVGFWLSFAAISVIAYAMTNRIHRHRPHLSNIWWKWGRVQYVVAVGLLPLLVLWFQQYPLLSIVANMIAVPFISLVIVPLVLAGLVLLLFAFPAGEVVLQFVGNALGYLWPFLEYLSNLEFSLWHIPSPSPLAFISAMIGVLIILLPKGLPARWLGIFWLFPLFFPVTNRPDVGEFWLTQLDVGQGLATVIQTQHHLLIYDTGDRFSERFDAGTAVVIPFLKHQHLQKPDLLIVSHSDRDHIGGTEAILTQYPTIQVLSSAIDKIDHADVAPCVEGKKWHWEGVDFELLNPFSFGNYRGNDSSCVLKISSGQHSVLLTGDIEQATESRLMKKHPDSLSSTVLIAPHHGSKTSSSAAFIDAVSPEIVVFSVGYRNRFGFPKQDIISRYESRRVRILNTARDGALFFRFEDSGVSVDRYRQEHLRFWSSEY